MSVLMWNTACLHAQKAKPESTQTDKERKKETNKQTTKQFHPCCPEMEQIPIAPTNFSWNRETDHGNEDPVWT